MDEIISHVYAVIDRDNRVIQIEGEYTLYNIANLDDAILVEQGAPCDRLNHAQNAYLPKPLLTDDGIYRYKYNGAEIVERSDDEIKADRVAIPQDMSPTIEDLVDAINILTDLVLGEGV